MKHIAIIPARSGSKRLPDKNIKLLNGKPLLSYAIETAIKSGLFDVVHVSTDSNEYAEIARQYGASVPFLRTAHSATDTASTWVCVLEALDQYEKRGVTFEYITLLQPTSPLCSPDDIRNAFNMLLEKQAKTVVSVCETEIVPFWTNVLPDDCCMDGFIDPKTRVPRQELKKYYKVNGAVYMFTVPWLRKQQDLVFDENCYGYIMPRLRSVDIDDQKDFLEAEAVLRYMQSCHEDNIP